MPSPADFVPAGIGLVGALVGAAASFAAQVFTHRGTWAREREAREHTLAVRRYEIERDTLLAIQDLLLEHKRVSVALQSKRLLQAVGAQVGDLTEPKEQYYSLARELRKLTVRLVDRDIARAVDDHVECVRKVMRPPIEETAAEEANRSLDVAQELLGEAIRRPPTFD